MPKEQAMSAAQTNAMITKPVPFAELSQYAKAFAESGLFADTRQAAQAIVKIQAGAEMGFAPFASMTGVHIIQGKVSLGANLMAAAVARSGKYRFKVASHTEQECAIEFFQGAESLGISRFTMKDAANASLTGKSVWKSFPKNMLYARAMSNGIRWFCPDVLGGGTIYTPEEIGADVNEDGLPLVSKEPEQPATPEPAANNHLSELSTDPVWILGTAGEDMIVRGKVKGTKILRTGEKNGRAWTLYAVRMTDDRAFQTFSQSVYDGAGDVIESGEEIDFHGKHDAKGNFMADYCEVVIVRPPEPTRSAPAPDKPKPAVRSEPGKQREFVPVNEIREEDIPF
jgi:hypothetical protein